MSREAETKLPSMRTGLDSRDLQIKYGAPKIAFSWCVPITPISLGFMADISIVTIVHGGYENQLIAGHRLVGVCAILTGC